MPNYKQKIIMNQLVVSRLEQLITEMIARDLGVKPEEVTPEFIHKWREDHLYPAANIDLTTLYGGYNGGGRRVMTGDEVESCRNAAEKFMSNF